MALNCLIESRLHLIHAVGQPKKIKKGWSEKPKKEKKICEDFIFGEKQKKKKTFIFVHLILFNWVQTHHQTKLHVQT